MYEERMCQVNIWWIVLYKLGMSSSCNVNNAHTYPTCISRARVVKMNGKFLTEVSFYTLDNQAFFCYLNKRTTLSNNIFKT